MVSACGWGSEEVTLTFLHFNDIYETQPIDGKGGFAQLMTALKQERANAEHAVTIVSGDFLSPSELSSITKGEQMVRLFNAVGVDIVSLGNHEFDFGVANLKKRMNESNFVWLGSNVFDQDHCVIGKVIAPYYIREIGGIKVGFIGILTPKTKEKALGGKHLVFIPPEKAAKRAVKALQDEGVDVIVLVTHLDIDQDLALVKEVPGIDLILGGHDHIPMTYYKKGVLVHKSGSDGEFLGVIQLQVIKDENGKKIIPSWRMRPIFGLEEDSDVSKIIESYFSLRKTSEPNIKVITGAISS